MCQSRPRRARSMSRLLFFAALLLCARAAYVTPSFDRLSHIYEKLQQLDLSHHRPQLYEKLDKLNSLTPEKLEKLDPDQDLDVDDAELISALQMWAPPQMDPDQLDDLVRELQSVREDDYAKSERMESDDSDAEWTDLDPVDGDNPGDYYADEEPESTSTSRPSVITPSTMTRLNYRETIMSAVDSIAATNERPTIVDDSGLSPADRLALRRAAFANIGALLKMGKCSEPQPRWFTVRHLAPAANIVYLPPCVQLHRCAPDSGCCYDEAEVCAPIAGQYVAIPFYLQKADGSRSMARMKFFNHTQCACVSRETLQTTVRSRVETYNISKKDHRESSEESRQRQNDWRASTEGHVEPEDDHTAPPQLRRCTCPTLFLARPLNDGICSCVCEWPDPSRRRDCLSLARGREHFGMRDRVCVDHGDCNLPTCEYGPYEKSNGKCPQRRNRRVRYYHRKLADTSD